LLDLEGNGFLFRAEGFPFSFSSLMPTRQPFPVPFLCHVTPHRTPRFDLPLFSAFALLFRFFVVGESAAGGGAGQRGPLSIVVSYAFGVLVSREM
jgi:hypothetical protein